jgi:hypothetical protein
MPVPQLTSPSRNAPFPSRGVLTNGATLLLAPAIGRWADRNAAQFQTILYTIVIQRVCIVAACVLWVFVFFATPPSMAIQPSNQTGAIPRDLIVAVVVALGIVERCCAVANNLIMERDWLPTMASDLSRPPLHLLNAMMRRIDLVSKILAPVAVSVVAVRASPAVLALVTAVLNLATVAAEVATARSAWHMCRALRSSRDVKTEPSPQLVDTEDADRLPTDDRDGESDHEDAPLLETRRRPEQKPEREKTALSFYFTSSVCLGEHSTSPLATRHLVIRLCRGAIVLFSQDSILFHSDPGSVATLQTPIPPSCHPVVSSCHYFILLSSFIPS